MNVGFDKQQKVRARGHRRDLAMDDVVEMVESEGQGISDEEVKDMTGSTTGDGCESRVRSRRPNPRVSGEEWS